MKRMEFAAKISSRMRELGYKKSVTVPAHSFYISDDGGNVSTIKIRPSDKDVSYNKEDVCRMLDAMVEVIFEAMKDGESVQLYRLGTIHPHYRATRKLKSFATGEMVDVPEHYVPKMDFANDMKAAAKIYGMKIADPNYNSTDECADVFDESYKEEDNE